MTRYDYLMLALQGIGVIALPLVVFVYREVRRFQENHLSDITRRLDRIENKLDAHVEWHASGGANLFR